ncbi:hypothetical protein LguiA_022251 [Lonicera macranthoides]
MQINKMDTILVLYNSVAACCAIAVVLCAWRIFDLVWVRPMKREKYLRNQGFKGSSYSLLFGDIKRINMMIKQAKSNPINLSHDIVPRVVPWIHDSIQKYGNQFFLWFGPVPRVHIMDPELIREILNKHQIFQKPKSHPLVKLFINGLITYEGEKWAELRRIVNPAFHVEKLKHMLPAFYLSCSEIMSKWENMLSTQGSCELDVWPYLQTLTGDAISRTAFGSSYKEGRKIFQLQKEQGELAIQVAQSIYICIPGLRYLPTKRNKRMKEIAKEVEFSIGKIIDKKIKAIKEGETSNDDLLSMLLESNIKEIQPHGNKIVGMSIKDVIEECKLFYVAGQETTSALLTWTMVSLSMHPDWQGKAREEVLQVFGNDKPNFDGLNRLKIVTMILYEVLRLYPPAVVLTRKVIKETTLGEITLPAGVQVALPIILTHRDIVIWGNDANEFKPERFSEGVSKATKSQALFCPFSAGPRICVGQNFAMLEAKMALAMILQRFSFELSTYYVHAPSSIVTLHPQYGAQLILHKQ